MGTVVADEFVGVQVAEYFVEFDHCNRNYIIYPTSTSNYTRCCHGHTIPHCIIIMIDNALERGREIWNTHKYKILAATSFLAAAYFALKFIQEEGEPTKWSSFV